MANKVHIPAQGDEPNKTVKRQEGKYNLGLYCSKCTQFFALAVLDSPLVGGVEFEPTANRSLRAPSVIIGSGGTFPRSPKCS